MPLGDWSFVHIHNGSAVAQPVVGPKRKSASVRYWAMRIAKYPHLGNAELSGITNSALQRIE
jgi:hypothetical protein